MGTPTVRRVRRPKARQDAPKRKNYRLRQSKLDAARRVLGTTTETETIERALDLVVFGERLASGTARARGRTWNDVVGEMERMGPGVPGMKPTTGSSARTGSRRSRIWGA